MKRFTPFKFVFLVCILIPVFPAMAQEETKFGDAPIEYLEMKYYDKDSTAEAVILGDFGRTSFIYDQFNDGFLLTFTRHTLIKIFNSNGYEWANIEISLYNDSGLKEEVGSLKGFTYNLVDGKVEKTKLDRKSKYTEQENDYWETEKFTMPDVKDGSVIEYTYTITSNFYYNLRSWTFQHSIPTMWSEYITTIPEYYNYRMLTQGYLPFEISETSNKSESINYTEKSRNKYGAVTTKMSSNKISYQSKVTRLAVKDAPAFIEEPFITTRNNYISKIDFEIASTYFPGSSVKTYAETWESLNSKFLTSEKFGLGLKRVNFINDEIETLQGKFSGEALIYAINDFVKERIVWDGYNARYIDNSLKEAYNKKSGNCADINLLLTGMLQKAGFDASPVLISTRSHGLVNEFYPLSKKFNYVICHVRMDGIDLLLDATDPGTPTGHLPVKCLNGRGWKVSENPGWVDLKPVEKHRIATQALMNFNEDLGLQGNILTNTYGYASFNSRKAFKEEGEEKFVGRIAEQKDAWEIEETRFENEANYSKPFKQIYKLKVNSGVDEIGNALLIRPLLTEGYTENPFKLEDRKYPVDFTFPRQESFSLNLTIPDGYQVDELPESAAVALPNKAAIFTYNINNMGNQIQISSNISINQYLFVPDEYANLKAFFDIIVSKHAEQIVLKKL